ncbi:MAG: hypothetical protein LBP23_05195 [Treponema sp.]|nr:hypothetical protein [Treponema sp.]
MIVCFLPFAVLGPGFTLLFWRSGWPLIVILVLALVFLNVFFLARRRLYRLLEREDWPALADYLESVVIRRGRYSPHLVRLLANTYLVMSDSAAVINLETRAAAARPALLETNALVFGAARILGGDTAGAVKFFAARLEKAKGKNREWIRWYYGFSRLLNRQFEEAAEEFRALAVSSSDALVTGLSSYFLDGTLRKNTGSGEDCRRIAGEGADRVRRIIKDGGEWKKEAAKIETEVHAVLLRRYIGEAESWLFGGKG